MNNKYLKILHEFFIIGEVYQSNINILINTGELNSKNEKVFQNLYENNKFIVLEKTRLDLSSDSLLFLTPIFCIKNAKFGLVPIFVDKKESRFLDRLYFSYKRLT